MNPETMARGLGFFSVGLGAAELAAADSLAKSLGMEGKEELIQLFGAREVASGIACLSGKPPTAGIWSRVAGDALDIAVLLGHLTPRNPKRRSVGFALGAVLGVTVVDLVTGMWLREGRNGPLTRFARRKQEQWEHQNEENLRAVEQKGGQYASQAAASAG